jgi:hypothetical protein
MDGGQSDGVNIAAGMGESSVTVENGLPPNHHSELCTERKNLKTWFSM